MPRETNADRKMYEKSSKRLAEMREARANVDAETALERRLAVEEAKSAREDREHKHRLRFGHQSTGMGALSDDEISEDREGGYFLGDTRPTSTCGKCFTVRSAAGTCNCDED